VPIPDAPLQRLRGHAAPRDPLRFGEFAPQLLKARIRAFAGGEFAPAQRFCGPRGALCIERSQFLHLVLDMVGGQVRALL
jgi:hypothetical protein